MKDFRCLVVGGGTVALRKVKGLLSAGALLQIIAPEVNAELLSIIEKNNLVWIRRKFEKNDTQGFRLVIAATNDKETNAAIRLEAAQNIYWLMMCLILRIVIFMFRHWLAVRH